MVLAVEVVDHEHVHAVEPEPLQAVLVGAQYALVAVVEAQLEGQTADPGSRRERLGLAGSRVHAPHFRRQDEVAAFLPAKRASHAVLGEAVAVPWRAVVQAYAALIGGLHDLVGLYVRDLLEEIPERSTAKPEGRDGQARASESPPRELLAHSPEAIVPRFELSPASVRLARQGERQ